jgi:transposase
VNDVIFPNTLFYQSNSTVSLVLFHMSSSEHVSTEDRWAIIAFHKHLKWKQERIAQQLKCNQATVSRIIEKWKTSETVEDLTGRGRKPLIDISNTDDNIVVNAIRNKRKSTSKAIKRVVEDELDIKISYKTITRLRRQLGFRPVHYRRRPKLTDQAKRNRFNYCLDNLDEDWKNIIFTDESTFILTDEHEVVWKRPGSPAIERPTEEYPAKFMIWGGVWCEGKTELCFIEGGVNSAVYQNILMKYLVRPGLSEEKEILQDGAPAHRAESTWEFIDEQGIDMRQNPGYSPELNPIEKVWGWIKHEVNKHNPATSDELKKLIQKYWNEIPQTTILQFIQHNTTVVNDIIVSGGDIIAEPNRHRLKPTQ